MSEEPDRYENFGVVTNDDPRWKPLPGAVPIPGQKLHYRSGEPWLEIAIPQATAEAIRKALRGMAEKIAKETPLCPASEWLEDGDGEWALSPSLVAWVMEADQ